MLDHPYSALGKRFFALLFDGMILFIPCLIASHMIPVIGGIIVWFFYAPILESSDIRATIGKRLVGIQVTDLEGNGISFRAALIRNVLKFVSSAIVFIGFFFVLFTEKKQSLHDLLAETVVIDGFSTVPTADAWIASIRRLFNSPQSTISALERLQALRDKGVLNEEEFQKQKEIILSQIRISGAS